MMIHPNPYPAHLFNAIARIEDQCDLKDCQLQEIGNIFIQHDMQGLFMIGVLHRHVEIPTNHILVHSMSEDTDVCRTLPLKDLSDLRPNSMLLNGDGLFQTYEYEYHENACDLANPVPALDNSFLCQLRDYILHERLEKTVSLLTNGETSLEYLLPNKEGTISIPEAHAPPEDLQSAVVTGWSFEVLDGSIITHAKYRCVVDQYGLHRRYKETLDGGGLGAYTFREIFHSWMKNSLRSEQSCE